MNRIFLFLMLLVVGCDKEPGIDGCADNIIQTIASCSTEEIVTADMCIIQEAVIQDSTGYEIDKFVYHHDGTNYYKIDRYYREATTDPYPGPIRQTILFSYQDGLISEVRISWLHTPDVAHVLTYSYEDPIVVIHFSAVKDDGTVLLSYPSEEFYVSDPKDSSYFYDGPVTQGFDFRSIFEFKGGNVIRSARPLNNGKCMLYGIKWSFRKNFYDDLPNVLKNYAVRYPFIEGKCIYGTMPETYVETNSNNIVGRFGNDGLNDGLSQYCWTFIKNTQQSYWIKKFAMANAPRGCTLTYHYDCE